MSFLSYFGLDLSGLGLDIFIKMSLTLLFAGEPALSLRWPGHGGGGAGAGRGPVLRRVQESARAVHHGARPHRPQREPRDDPGLQVKGEYCQQPFQACLRLSTHANLGDLDTFEQTWQMGSANLALIQVSHH